MRLGQGGKVGFQRLQPSLSPGGLHPLRGPQPATCGSRGLYGAGGEAGETKRPHAQLEGRPAAQTASFAVILRDSCALNSCGPEVQQVKRLSPILQPARFSTASNFCLVEFSLAGQLLSRELERGAADPAILLAALTFQERKVA